LLVAGVADRTSAFKFVTVFRPVDRRTGISDGPSPTRTKKKPIRRCIGRFDLILKVVVVVVEVPKLSA